MKLLALLIPLVLLGGCNTSPSKDLGCLTDLGNAEQSFNDAQKGAAESTVTDADYAAAMKTVKDKLDDLNVVNPVPEIKAKADDGAQAAGRLRVALLGGGSPVPADVDTLRADINALDAACVKAGK